MYLSGNIQWNPSITDTYGNNVLAFIQRWPLLRGCFVHIWDLGAWPLYSNWHLFRGGLFTEVPLYYYFIASAHHFPKLRCLVNYTGARHLV